MMSPFLVFLEQLLKDGTVVMREKPVDPGKDEASAVEVLQRDFSDRRLDVAGPELDFEPEIALATAKFVQQACWHLVDRSESDAHVERNLRLPPPHTAAQHLTGDMMLRFTPTLYQRARALVPDDSLTKLLTKTLREWPLTGVLSDVQEEPLSGLQFDDHAGLLMLYAERWAETEKRAWLPKNPGLDYVQLVYQQAGNSLPAFADVQEETNKDVATR